jgi:hypothetical protein
MPKFATKSYVSRFATKHEEQDDNVVPSNAMLNEDGSPMLNEDGSYILSE